VNCMADSERRHDSPGQGRYGTWVHDDELARLSPGDMAPNKLMIMLGRLTVKSQKGRRWSEHNGTTAAVERAHAVRSRRRGKNCQKDQ